MAYGACSDCGCSFVECECPGRKVEPVKENVMIQPHSTYIADYPALKRVRELPLRGAFGLLKHSRYLDVPGNYPGDAAFLGNAGLLNKGWAVVDVKPAQNVVEAVYCHDGKYYLYRASLAGFLKGTREQTAFSSALRRIHEEIASLADAVPG